MSHAKSGEIRTCLHPEAAKGTCSSIIAAHTLQKSRVLNAITDEKNTVSTFFPPIVQADGIFQVQKRGWNKASTFSAFCGKHDDETFAELEKSEYGGTLREIFLIAYRAVCWEVFQKRKLLKAQPALLDVIDRGASEQMQRIAQERMGSHFVGADKGLEDLEYLKAEMDGALTTGNLTNLCGCEVALTGPVSVVTTGAISPNRLLNGLSIQTMEDTKTRVQGVAFGVDIHDNKPRVVFCCLKKDKAAMAFIDELLSMPDSILPEYIMQFFFAFCENTYFSQNWWDGLKPEQQRLVYKLAVNTNPYSFFPEYNFDAGISSWSLEGKRRL